MRLLKNLFKSKEETKEVEETSIDQSAETVESQDQESQEEIETPTINENGQIESSLEVEQTEQTIDYNQMISDLNERINGFISTLEAKDGEILSLTNELNSTKESLANLTKENEKTIALETAKHIVESGFSANDIPQVSQSKPVSLLEQAKKLKGQELVNFYNKHKADLFKEGSK
jgi:hypothetical protein